MLPFCVNIAKIINLPMRNFHFILLFVSFAVGQSVSAAKNYSAFQVMVTGKGQPVLLIPGATCSAHAWDETIAHYKGRFQFHAFTLAGYAGVTPMANGPYLDSFKTQIEQYIQDNHLNHVVLIGHSIGGFLSLWIGTDDLAAVDKIVSVDALPFFAAARNPAAKDGFNEEMAKTIFEQYSHMSDSAMFRSQMGVAKAMCNDSSHWKQIAAWGVQSDKRTMAYTVAEMLGHDLRTSIKSIKVPVLVLAAYSAVPQFPGYTREIALKLYTDQYSACASCQVQMPSGGTKHFIMYDNPQWYFSELDKFLLVQ
jgi:N-formylmaleamate deformylase